MSSPGGGGEIFLSFILQFIEGGQWFDDRENYTFPRIQRGLTFSRGGATYSRGGVLIIIFKETHITCDFLGGPPLWIRTCNIAI